MKNKIISCLLLLNFIFILSCKTFTEVPPEECRKISTDAPVSDLMLDQSDRNNPRIIFMTQNFKSKDPNGELTRTGSISYMGLSNRDFEKIQTFSIIDRDEWPLHPFAMDMINENNRTLLFVVNHALSDTFAVEIFEVKKNELRFIQRIRSNLFVKPFGIAVVSDRLFYIVEHFRWSGKLQMLENFFPLNFSRVLRYRDGQIEPVIFRVGRGTAVALNEKNDRLFVASANRKKIMTYEIKPSNGRVVAELLATPLDGSPDRIGKLDSNHLIFPIHRLPSKLFDPSKTLIQRWAAAVVVWNPETNTKKYIYSDSRKYYDAVTASLYVQGRLYLTSRYKAEISSCKVKNSP